MLQREKIIQYLVGEIVENGWALQQEGEEPNHGAGPGSAGAQETEGSGSNVCTFYGFLVLWIRAILVRYGTDPDPRIRSSG
jgi:hypothetical protein